MEKCTPSVLRLYCGCTVAVLLCYCVAKFGKQTYSFRTQWLYLPTDCGCTVAMAILFCYCVAKFGKFTPPPVDARPSRKGSSPLVSSRSFQFIYNLRFDTSAICPSARPTPHSRSSARSQRTWLPSHQSPVGSSSCQPPAFVAL
eukprot:scaffold93_cov112-Isochrysis_galbana.AAC.2